MSPPRRSLVALAAVVSCSSPSDPRDPPKSPATTPESPAATPPAPPAAVASQGPRDVLGFEDFTEVLGIRPGATADDVIAALGPPDDFANFDPHGEGQITLRYDGNIVITLRPSGGIQLLIRSVSPAFRDRHPTDPALSLLDETCGAAARRLPFMDQVGGGMRSCKHYTNELYLGVTVLCRGTLSMVTVVWEPLPAELRAAPPADYCN